MRLLRIKNIHMLPKINKIILSGGINSKINTVSSKTVATIIHMVARSKPVFIKAKVAISGFKIKQHQIIGFKVTLRSKKMYNFLDRLIYKAIPKIKGFKGLNLLSFDKGCNISFGIKDCSVFSEAMPYEGINQIGFNVTICVNTMEQGHVVTLLNGIGLRIANV